jgi:hypothetical protein
MSTAPTANGTATNLDTKPKPKTATITIRLTFRDAPVDIALTDASIQDVENIISRTLNRADWKPAKPAQGGGFGPRKPQTPPAYAADGSLLCPHHQKPLNKRDFGWTCSHRLPEGDPNANKNGYCKYVWNETAK